MNKNIETVTSSFKTNSHSIGYHVLTVSSVHSSIQVCFESRCITIGSIGSIEKLFSASGCPFAEQAEAEICRNSCSGQKGARKS